MTRHEPSRDGGSIGRRALLRNAAAAAGSLAVAGVGSGPVLGATASTAAGVERTDTTVESVDGTTIHVSLYEPGSEGPHPALFTMQGGVATRASRDDRARALADRGYVAVTYDPRGIADSGGTWDPGGDGDIDDVSAIIDLLAGRDAVRTDDTGDPRVGMEGVSGGGWRAVRAASRDDRIDAIAGTIVPYDASFAVGQNGVLVWPWAYFINYAIRLPHVDPTQELLDLTAEAIDTKEPPEDLLAYFAKRSPRAGLSRVETPTLLLNGWHDRAFPPRTTFELYRGLADADERRLVMLDLGHDFEGSPVDATQFRFLRRVRSHWFAKHLDDETPPAGSPLQDPPVHFYHAQSDSFEAYESLPDGTTSFDLATGRSGGATALTTTEDGPSRAAFDLAVTDDLELAGASHLSLAVTPTGGEPHLFAALQDVPPGDGDPVHIKDQITVVEVTEPGRVDLDLNGVRRTVSAGHTLRLVLALNDDALAGLSDRRGPFFTDGLYVDSTTPAGVTVHHSRGRQSTLTVTTTGD